MPDSLAKGFGQGNLIALMFILFEGVQVAEENPVNVKPSDATAAGGDTSPAGAPGAPPVSQSKSELYPKKEESRMENLPNRAVQGMSDPGVRTHGAASVSDQTYWSGHVAGGVLIFVSVLLIVLGRGPRKVHAMARLWEQKQAYSERKSGG
jgi:hypothetical protein